MRNYIFTERERKILALHFSGEKLIRSDYVAVSKLKLRGRKALDRLKADIEMLQRLLT